MGLSLYKYKEVNFDSDGQLSDETKKYVINPIQTSHFYLPTRKCLNDPTEGVFTNHIQRELNGYLQGVTALGERQDLLDPIYSSARAITQSLDTSGIFSLTSNHTDELMWAHYANSHTGIAIEYDLDLLTRFTPNHHLKVFDVSYEPLPPSLGLQSIINKNAMKIMFGYKSPRWKYEGECRVVVDNISGQMPHDYRAVKSITFGLRFPSEKRQEFIDLVKEKVPTFYQIVEVKDSYQFDRVMYQSLGNHKCELQSLDIDWEQHLAGIEGNERERLIETIESDLLSDPHYKGLVSAEVSSIEPQKIAVNYELSHGMDVHLATQYQKLMV